MAQDWAPPALLPASLRAEYERTARQLARVMKRPRGAARGAPTAGGATGGAPAAGAPATLFPDEEEAITSLETRAARLRCGVIPQGLPSGRGRERGGARSRRVPQRASELRHCQS